MSTMNILTKFSLIFLENKATGIFFIYHFADAIY